MANALYDNGRQGILDRTIDITAATIKAGLLRTATFSAAHSALSDVTGAGATLVASAALSGKTYTAGVLNASATVLSAVATGAACNAIVLYNDTGTASTSRLIAYIDTATGLPVTPNGQDITISWDTGASKIFKL